MARHGWLVFTAPKRCLASLNVHETMQIGHPILWKNLLAPRWTLRSGKCHLFLLYTVDMMREYVNWILSSAFGFQSCGCSLQLWYKIRKREGSAWIDSCNEFPSYMFPLFLNLCLFSFPFLQVELPSRGFNSCETWDFLLSLPETNSKSPWKSMVGRWISFSEALFSGGATFILGRVVPLWFVNLCVEWGLWICLQGLQAS